MKPNLHNTPQSHDVNQPTKQVMDLMGFVTIMDFVTILDDGDKNNMDICDKVEKCTQSYEARRTVHRSVAGR